MGEKKSLNSELRCRNQMRPRARQGGAVLLGICRSGHSGGLLPARGVPRALRWRGRPPLEPRVGEPAFGPGGAALSLPGRLGDTTTALYFFQVKGNTHKNRFNRNFRKSNVGTRQINTKFNRKAQNIYRKFTREGFSHRVPSAFVRCRIHTPGCFCTAPHKNSLGRVGGFLIDLNRK